MSAAKLFTAILTALLIFTTVSLANFNPFSSQLAHPDRQMMPVAHAQAPPGRKILVDAGDEETLKGLAASGAIRLADYGAFSLWRVTSTQMAKMSNRAALLAQPDFDLIPLRGGRVIQTGQGGREPTIPGKLRQVTGEEFEFGLVQFIGPVKDEWLAVLTKSGLELVIYLPHNAYVVWGRGANQTLARLVAGHPFIQWTGPYHPAYRLEPTLQQAAATRDAGELVEVTVQFYRTRNTPASLARLLQLGGAVRKSPEDILGFTNITLALPAGRLIEVANWPDVFNVEPWTAPKLLDEIQNQIIAGNVISASGVISPSGPGYLAWLSAMGFPTTTTSYPVVDIVDDGIDQGDANNVLDPDFHEFGSLANPDRVLYITNCTPDSNGNGVGGHGHLNMGIVGSYNNLAGAPHVDAAGYRRGLGVSPYGRLAGTKIFRNNGEFDSSACGGNDQGVVASSFLNGANFTSNSWGGPVGGAYNASAQAYDALTRDAHGPTAGNQQMLHIFAAGNDGPDTNSVGSPGTAKNVLTVGATENVRDEGIADGCGKSNANNADDMATFSSRGPLDDNRVKPDVVAPGMHVQGPASKDPGFSGEGVCGGPSNDGVPPPTDAYYPSGQTLYTWSSGTSHSTPAIAGAASLTWEYYKRVLNPGQTPSPAMLKALLLNSSRYLSGSEAGGTLPSNNQGWGDVNLGLLTDGTPRRLLDQSFVFNNTGQIYYASGAIISPAKPFRVSLVWTDAPGSTISDAYVNNLDLEVIIGNQIYKGNIFTGANSTTGGAFDFRNNVENVFVPAGAGGPYSVRVIARNIVGDGLPGNGDPTDQDFALVIYNGDDSPQTVLAVAGLGVSDAAGGNNNGAVDPGETIRLDISLANYGVLTATGVSGQVTATGGEVTMLNDTSPYAAIASTATVTNTIPYTFTVSPDQTCGQLLTFIFTATHSSDPLAYNFSLPVGKPKTPLAENFDSVSAPALPAGWTTSATGAQIPWLTLNNNSDTPPNHTFAPAPEEIGLSELMTPVFSVTTTSAQLTFRNNYDLESGFDGSVLEIKIGALAFTDILTAGGSFVSGGYNDTLDSDFGNPLIGRQVWSGSSNGYQTAVVNLPAAAAGQPVQLRWRVGTDMFAFATGQRIDTISVADGITCAPPLLPDLTLTKSTPSNPAAASAPLTYTLRVNNLGPGATTAVTVTDTLPANVTFNSVSGAGWSCNQVGGVITCTRAGLAPGVAPDILITTTPLITNGLITNTAVVTTPADTNPNNNNTTLTTTVTPPVDLAIVKTVTPALVKPGQVMTYTLVYTNHGPNAATGVVITDIVPVSVTNASYASSGAVITATSSTHFIWQVANLALGQGGAITLTGVLSNSLNGETIFTNTTTIASARADVNMSNNASAVGVMVAGGGGSIYLPVILK